MKEKYNQYLSEETVTVSKKMLFTDSCGFPNENAFLDFVKSLGENEEYYLICINADLTASNEIKGFAYGTLALRRVYLLLRSHFFVFRIGGGKFNLVVKKDDIEKAEQILSSYSEQYEELISVYYGTVSETPIFASNIGEIRRQGVERMYRDKALKTNRTISEARYDAIVGNKGNTPLELQETSTHKFRETMWYGTIRLEERKPATREVTVYVFPTEFKEKLASLNMIVVVDDLLNTRLFTGNSVNFGFDGIRFTVTSRFDNEGHLNIVCFKDRDSKGECGINVVSHEGSCIPASFGKRLEDGNEIYPIKINTCGSYEYVLWNAAEKKAVYDSTGIVSIDGKNYAVYSDAKGIDLVEQ